MDIPHITADDVVLDWPEMVETLRAGHQGAWPDILFGADIIAGAPRKSDAMFENPLKPVEECGLTWPHVFPFSAREGMPAARIPPVGRRVVAARLAGVENGRLIGVSLP